MSGIQTIVARGRPIDGQKAPESAGERRSSHPAQVSGLRAPGSLVSLVQVLVPPFGLEHLADDPGSADRERREKAERDAEREPSKLRAHLAPP